MATTPMSLILAITTIFLIKFADTDVITLYMPLMTANSSLIHSQCPNSEISNLTFNTAFAYTGQPVCSHNINPIFPVELTADVGRLLSYQQTAQTRYRQCITDSTCDIANLSEWKQLAMTQYQSCNLCSSYEGELCIDSTVVTRGQQLSDILKSMYLYAQFECYELATSSDRFTTEARVDRREANRSEMSFNRNQFECSDTESIEIEQIVERVRGTAVHYSNKTSALMRTLNLSQLSEATTHTVQVLNRDWSTLGGYYWGQDSGSIHYPHKLIITYTCESRNITRNGDPTEAGNETQLGTTNMNSVDGGKRPSPQLVTVIVTVLLAMVVLTMAAVVIVILVMRRQKRKHIFMTVT